MNITLKEASEISEIGLFVLAICGLSIWAKTKLWTHTSKLKMMNIVRR